MRARPLCYRQIRAVEHGIDILKTCTPYLVGNAAGLTRIVRDAGGHVLTDTCSAIGQALPPGTKVAALDSAKQVHYLPAIMGIEAWFGTTRDCIDAALTGRWSGELR
jgi:hypothetical protein